MYRTHVRPSADLRAHYNEIAKIANDKNQVIITKNGKMDVVVIGADEYQQYEKYVHEQYILACLDEGLAQLDDPTSRRYSHDEVWATLEKEWNR